MKTARIIFRLVCVGILIAAIFQITTRAQAEEHTEAQAPETTAAQPVSKVDAAIVQELENKRLALESKSHELEEQEYRLKEREKELDKKLKEMEHLRAAVSGELDAQKKNNEEKVLKMVAVFETMSPKSASGVLETLDDWLSVEVLKRMDVKRVAKVMNLMDKNRSAKLSELLTGYYRPDAERKISSVASAAAPTTAAAPVGQAKDTEPKKGGKK